MMFVVHCSGGVRDVKTSTQNLWMTSNITSPPLWRASDVITWSTPAARLLWIQWPFLQKNLNQRSLTPRWPLTPHLLRSHVWLYPRIILSKSHENTSKYVDIVNLFAKTWTKGHWPLDDLWPHICWGYMCDCAHGSLCPSPMGIRQCMWIQLSILQKLPHTYIHTHTTYILHTTYRISDHIVSQARQSLSGETKKCQLLEFGKYKQV